MPAQPLGKTKGVNNLTFGAGAVWERPELAVHVMGTIAAWSSADSHLLGITAHLLKADPDVAMAMLLAVESQAAQRAIIIAAAGAVLAEEDIRLFNAVITSTSASRATRNCFAHRVWGTSSDLPDALLLLDSKHHNITVAAYEKWRRIKQRKGRDAGAQPETLNRSKVYVWREADLQEAHMAALRAVNDFGLLGALVAMDFSSSPVAEAIRRQLSANPLVQDRLQHEANPAPKMATKKRAKKPA